MNKIIFTVVLMVSAIGGFAMAQGARGIGGGGISGQPIDGTTIKPKSVQVSGTADQFVCTSTTATCEVESSASAATMTATVPAFDIGPTATPDANDQLNCFSYGPSGSKTRVLCVDKEGDLIPGAASGQTLGAANKRFILFATDLRDSSNTRIGFATNGAASGNDYIDGSFGITTGSNAHVFKTLNTYPTGNKLMSVRNVNTERFFIDDAGLVNTVSSFNSAAASGNQAFTCANTGCRLSLGNTGRYFEDSGTRLSTNTEFAATNLLALNVYTGAATIKLYGNQFARAGSVANRNAGEITFAVHDGSDIFTVDGIGAATGDSYAATATSGSSFTGGNASNVMTLLSNAADAQTTSTLGAVNIRAANDIFNGDMLLSVQDSTSTTKFRVREDGATYAGQFISRYHMADNPQPVELGTYMSPASEKAPIRLVTDSAFTAEDVAHVSGYNGGTQTFTFSKDGLLRVNKGNAAKPTCNADNRGRIYYLDNAGSGNDTAEICMAVGASYAWQPYAFADANASFNQVVTTATGSGTKAMQIESGTVICLDGSACTRTLRGDATESALSTVRFYGNAIFQGFIDAVSSVRFRNTAITIADSGGAGAAAYTQSTYPSAVKYTCNDADGCDITMSEVGIIDGLTMRFTNESANTVNFTDTAGVTELAGNFAMGQWDTLVLQYNTDRWVEVSRSNN